VQGYQQRVLFPALAALPESLADGIVIKPAVLEKLAPPRSWPTRLIREVGGTQLLTRDVRRYRRISRPSTSSRRHHPKAKQPDKSKQFIQFAKDVYFSLMESRRLAPGQHWLPAVPRGLYGEPTAGLGHQQSYRDVACHSCADIDAEDLVVAEDRRIRVRPTPVIRQRPGRAEQFTRE
jgi:hypothetical protein